MDNDIPFYIQIKNYIKQKISNNEFEPGDKVPSERELKEKFKISRSTIRKAISELVYEGFLVKIQGKGTFVSQNIRQNYLKSNNKVVDIKTLKEKSADRLKYSVIKEKIVAVQPDLRAIFNSQKSRKYYKLKRKVMINEMIIGLEKIWTLPEYIDGLSEMSQHKLEMLGTGWNEEIFIKDSDELKESCFKKGVPLFEVRKKIYREEDTIIYMESYYNSQQVKLTRKGSHEGGMPNAVK